MNLLENILVELQHLNRNLNEMNQRLNYTSPIKEPKEMQNAKLKKMIASMKRDSPTEELK